MNLREYATGGVIGVMVSGLPLWVFFEAKVERRVTNEVKVAELQKDCETLSKAITEMELDLDGFKWTIEGKVGALEKGMAVSHAKDH